MLWYSHARTEQMDVNVLPEFVRCLDTQLIVLCVSHYTMSYLPIHFGSAVNDTGSCLEGYPVLGCRGVFQDRESGCIESRWLLSGGDWLGSSLGRDFGVV